MLRKIDFKEHISENLRKFDLYNQCIIICDFYSSLLLLQFILIWKETAFFFAIPTVSLGRFIISYCDPMVYVAFAVMWLPVRLLRVQVQPIFTMLFTIYTVKAIRSAVRVCKRRTNVSILKIWNAILLYSSGIVCAYFRFFCKPTCFIFYLSGLCIIIISTSQFFQNIRAAMHNNITDLMKEDCSYWQPYE